MRRALLTIAIVGATRLASATPASAKAEALFRQGRELMTAGKLAEACAAFDASQQLEPATTTLFNQADCREKSEQLATAWGLFVDAERQTRDATDDVGVRLHKVALERAGKLEPRLSKVTVKITNPPKGLVIARSDPRGDEVIEAGEWNRALPIDGGSYTFTARLDGHDVWSETIMVGNASDNQTVEVALRHLEARPAATGEVVATAPAPAAHTTNVRALATTIGAGVLLGGALVFDLLGNSQDNDAVAQHSQSLLDSANEKRYLAQGFVLAGLACAGAAVYFWLHDGSEAPAHVATRKFVTPIASSNFAGIGIGGGW